MSLHFVSSPLVQVEKVPLCSEGGQLYDERELVGVDHRHYHLQVLGYLEDSSNPSRVRGIGLVAPVGESLHHHHLNVRAGGLEGGRERERKREREREREREGGRIFNNATEDLSARQYLPK